MEKVKELLKQRLKELKELNIITDDLTRVQIKSELDFLEELVEALNKL